jgi:hypothetical protein
MEECRTLATFLFLGTTRRVMAVLTLHHGDAHPWSLSLWAGSPDRSV